MEYCLPDFTWNESFIPTRGNPVAIPTSPQNVNFAMNSQWARTSTCTGSMTWFAMESFPSGHTASAFAVGVFLALYLNGKLKAFADYHTSFWKMVAVLAPVLGAFFVAGSLLVDHVSVFPLPPVLMNDSRKPIANQKARTTIPKISSSPSPSA